MGSSEKSSRASAPRYDKELIRDGIVAVCFHYLGPGRRQGARYVWRCPDCGKDEKFAANAQRRLAGCLNAGCSMPKTMDALQMISHLEGIPAQGSGFVRILARGYGILNLTDPHPAANAPRGQPANGPGPDGRATEGRWQSARAASERNGASGTRSSDQLPVLSEDVVTVEEVDVEDIALRGGRVRYEPLDAHRTYETGLCGEAVAYALYEEEDFSLDEHLLDVVYEEILESCPLLDHHKSWLKNRGVSAMTAVRARFGSMTRGRVREVKKTLLTKFSEQDLLRVPGFSKKPSGRLAFTLSGEYLLIPYHDADHRITTIEGRAIGAVPKGMGKYVSLRGSGNHLYVFPELLPDRVEAFCEGPMGAVVAAQSGIAVGAIQGVRRYRGSREGTPPPELAGADFSGRRIPYIPDVDVNPEARADVEAEIPNACRHLIEAQNGVPTVAILPAGKDLDEWLLTKPSSERRADFTSFVSGAVALERYLQLTAGGGPRDDHPAQELATDSRRGPRAEVPLGPPEGESPRTPRAETDKSQVPPVIPAARQHPEPGHAVDAGKVYAAMMRMATLQDRDVRLLARYGIPGELVRKAGIGSMSAVRARAIVGKLTTSFGRERLLELDGFSDATGGRVELDLSGDYCLIPYRAASGAFTAVHAIPVSKDPDGTCLDPERKPLIRGTPGDHLYVPAGEPERIEAITTSVLEALRLCACGVRAASIRKVGAYSPAPGRRTLVELEGVAFDGRKILYAPATQNSSLRHVMTDAPNALRSLIARHGGVPAMLAEQPEGTPDGKPVAASLGERLLSLPAWERREAFDALMERARPFDGLTKKETRRRGPQSGPGTVSGKGEDAPGPAHRAEDQPEAPRLPPASVPPAGYRSPAPPTTRQKLLTPDEVLSGLGALVACAGTALVVLTLWYLPQHVAATLPAYLGPPVGGGGIEPLGLALGFADAALASSLGAIRQALGSALYWGCASACLAVPYTVHRRRKRRKRVLRMLGRTPPRKSWLSGRDN